MPKICTFIVCSAVLPDEVGRCAIGFGCVDTSGLSCLDTAQEPGHVFADVSHGGKALGIPIGVAGHATKHVVPVRGGDHGHLVDGEVLVEHIEGGRRAAATGDGDGSARLVCKGFASGIECAIEGREDAPAGVRIVDGRAEDKAVGLLGGSDELVHHVVVKGATTAKLAALAATDTIANGLGAQLKHLGINAFCIKLLYDLGECAGGVAVCLGAAID